MAIMNTIPVTPTATLGFNTSLVALLGQDVTENMEFALTGVTPGEVSRHAAGLTPNTGAEILSSVRLLRGGSRQTRRRLVLGVESGTGATLATGAVTVNLTVNAVPIATALDIRNAISLLLAFVASESGSAGTFDAFFANVAGGQLP